MPYRRSGEVLQVRTAVGRHRIWATADSLEVRAPDNSYVHITSRAVILHSRARMEHLALHPSSTRLVVARNSKLDDVSVWLEADTRQSAAPSSPPIARRLFSLTPS